MEDLQRKLKEYVDRFQAVDEECYRQAIPNDEAYTWLKDEIPFLECPDEVLEETYFFAGGRFASIGKRLRLAILLRNSCLVCPGQAPITPSTAPAAIIFAKGAGLLTPKAG